MITVKIGINILKNLVLSLMSFIIFNCYGNNNNWYFLPIEVNRINNFEESILYIEPLIEGCDINDNEYCDSRFEVKFSSLDTLTDIVKIEFIEILSDTSHVYIDSNLQFDLLRRSGENHNGISLNKIRLKNNYSILDLNLKGFFSSYDLKIKRPFGITINYELEKTRKGSYFQYN